MAEKIVSGMKVTCEDSILACGVTLETIVSCKAFTDWLGEIDRERFNVRSCRSRRSTCSVRASAF